MSSNITYVKGTDCQDAQAQATQGILQRLQRNLAAGRSVLVLLTGGSSQTAAVAALNQLTDEQLSKIGVGQMNERFGDPAGHWASFKQAMPRHQKLAYCLCIGDMGASLEETVNNYDHELSTRIQETDYVLGTLGIGADGRVGGMLPVGEDTFQLFYSDDYVVGYEHDGVERVMMTDYGMRGLDEIVIYACGAEKRAVLQQLSQVVPVFEMPAQILKVYDRVTIYSAEV